MQALLINGYGPIASNVALCDIKAPALAPLDVLIDVHAVSINPIDYKIVEGALKQIQSLKLPVVMGFDVSGVVSAVGKDVRIFRPGDAVYGRSDRHRMGTFAQQAVLHEDWITLKPTALSFSDAASLPLVALTCIQALHDRARAQAGQRILIHAGSGGVGSFAIQYAKAIGLHVTTTTSSRNAEMVRELGADTVIRYDVENYLTKGSRYDIVFDTLGGPFTLDAFSVVNAGGCVVSIAGVPDRQFADQVGASFMLRLAMRLISWRVWNAAKKYNAQYCRFLTESSGRQLNELAPMLNSKQIKPVIDRVFSFADIVAALLYAATGRARGKIVVEVQANKARI